jgi:hypothetical protein
MTRRKCKTWQPNEITSIIRSSQGTKGDEPSTSQDFTQTQSSSSPMDGQAQFSFATEDSDRYQSSQAGLEYHTRTRHGERDAVSDVDIVQNTANKKEGQALGKLDASSRVCSASLMQEPDSEKTSTDSIVDSSQPTPTVEASQELVASDISKKDGLRQAGGDRTLKRTSSSLRLSMSLDGKAQVVMGGGTPSPPKKPQGPMFSRRANVLQRSQSAISSGNQKVSALGQSVPWTKTRPHGRSADARTWEFYCDSDARNSLTKAAELDQKGSALGVIGLMRSGSGARKPLNPLHKENILLKRSESGKRKSVGDHEGQKPKLARTASSVARLQSIASSADALEKPQKLGQGSEVGIWQDPSGDSDKENYDPGVGGQPRRRQTPRASTESMRGILKENTAIMSHSSSLGAMMERDPTLSARKTKQRVVQDQENQAPSLDGEVSAFMGESKPARAEDEMDAVQNLLSLSQGAWR